MSPKDDDAPRMHGNMIVARLPGKNASDLLATRSTQAQPSLVDLVETCLVALWPKDEVRAHIDPITKAESVEGSVRWDHSWLTFKVMEQARATNMRLLRSDGKAAKASDVGIALSWAKRRYNLQPKQRLLAQAAE